MSIDITIKERKEFHCPDCGRLVTTQDISAECSGGRAWYPQDWLKNVIFFDSYKPTLKNEMEAKEE